MTPRVSIVTTVYDRVDCLKRCIRSLQHSEYRDFEHIVVSDHPSADVVAQLQAVTAEAGVAYLDLPQRYEDWGVTPAQVGLDHAVGEYVCFLSDDNAYLPGHFAPLVEALDADPGLGFAYSSCLYAGRKELRVSPPLGARIDLGQPLFRRSVIRDLLGDVLPCKGAFAWDWELIHALLERQATWQHIDEATFVFRLTAYPELMEALA